MLNLLPRLTNKGTVGSEILDGAKAEHGEQGEGRGGRGLYTVACLLRAQMSTLCLPPPWDATSG